MDPYDFAVDNFDDHWNLFGIWPRAVQNAAEHQMDGAVTRFRTWSQAYDTLAAGGRVVMSVGQPLYSGHLMMLAGFDAQGDPIVHDPARQNGYTYEYNKYQLSQSWFNKGGVGYTFYPEAPAVGVNDHHPVLNPAQAMLYQNFPNPFNPSTTLRFELETASQVRLSVFDLEGREIAGLVNANLDAGPHQKTWSAETLPAGIYLVRLETESSTLVKRITLIK